MRAKVHGSKAYVPEEVAPAKALAITLPRFEFWSVSYQTELPKALNAMWIFRRIGNGTPMATWMLYSRLTATTQRGAGRCR